MMLQLVRLNNVTVKGCRFHITKSFTEVDEALVSYKCDALARKLTSGHARRSTLERAQIVKQRRVAALSRIDSIGIHAKGLQPVSDQPIMLGFVACLTCESQLYVKLRGCAHPHRRHLARFELILEGDAQKPLDR